ncbi:MAG: hypothetical protein C4520_21245 [Candidatus Abyssobacteria bacterium SURF_5]|jgi:hypothetical protein|uniref:Uncharacterized protein n=1 Tax=Abyssobacteria bacterium (strain SURF_5) TaxID=2093360 RepID=A0A3A4MWK0_ABYX5|nr:MAG: hypothetical protein C4520_21245 [Candidatus Abyssubacteria bacterium SURF_5]
MKFEGAIIEEQGIKFAIVKVGKDIFEVPGRARDRMISFQSFFPDMAIVFMAAETGEVPQFYGRPDIVRLMMSKPLENIVWEQYSFDEAAEN